MKILDKYIAKNILGALGLITLMLIGMHLFILLINQIGELGNAQFGMTQAFFFVLLQIPYQVYLFFPMASLLGCLIGLGNMANHSELVVMRASGMSIGQITNAVLKSSIILIFLVTLMGETIIPLMTHYANDYKAAALSNGQSLRTANGLWLRYNNDFILINTVLPQNVLMNIFQFRFDDSHHLIMARSIREAKFIDHAWMAYGVNQTEFSAKRTYAKTFATLPYDIPLNPQVLKINGTDPNEMSLRELYRYIQEQKRNQQNVSNYRFTFLQRLIQPFTTMVMMMIAIPFIFGPLRSSTVGSKLLVGITIGFSFHIINHFFGPLSTIFQLPPELAALGPTFIFALFGLFLIKRMK